jgi:hypothetical protein
MLETVIAPSISKSGQLGVNKLDKEVQLHSVTQQSPCTTYWRVQRWSSTKCKQTKKIQVYKKVQH